MQPAHYFSSLLATFCQDNEDGRIQNWLVSLSYDDLLTLKYQIEVLTSPLPIGMSSDEGFDLNYLAFAAESHRRKKIIVDLKWEKRKKVLVEISLSVDIELQHRRSRFEAISADAEIVFGSAEKARSWMFQNNADLRSTPMSKLNTETGTDEVRKVLASITCGGAV
ncbi:MAG: MbcA/ParS/Xre antitoxin family protein [Gammaproteobacteria bacterium]|nr:MbcA/ParS/Xre antitoxin family protein [Gammaproteobacteria bacterium]